MTAITRAATPEDLDELLHSTSRATLAWAISGDVTATPVAFRFQRGRYLVGTRPHTLEPGIKAVVLVDEGSTYFQLRGLRVRGRLGSVPDDFGEPLGRMSAIADFEGIHKQGYRYDWSWFGIKLKNGRCYSFAKGAFVSDDAGMIASYVNHYLRQHPLSRVATVRH